MAVREPGVRGDARLFTAPAKLMHASAVIDDIPIALALHKIAVPDTDIRIQEIYPSKWWVGRMHAIKR